MIVSLYLQYSCIRVRISRFNADVFATEARDTPPIPRLSFRSQRISGAVKNQMTILMTGCGLRQIGEWVCLSARMSGLNDLFHIC